MSRLWLLYARAVALAALGVPFLMAPASLAQESPEASELSAGPPPEWGLQQCILTALRNNPQVWASAEGIAVAESAVDRSRSGYYPQAALDASTGAGDRVSGTTTGGGGATTVGPGADAGLGVDWTFWQTGRHEAVRESELQLDAARLDYSEELSELVEQVAIDYFAVLAAEELVAVAEDGVEAAQGHVRDVQVRIRLGSAAEVDIYAVEVDLAQAELDLIDARTGARLALARLRNSLGLDHTHPLRIAKQDIDASEELPTLDAAVSLALAKRPDLSASEATIRARQYGLDIAEKGRRPNVQVGGSLGYDHSLPASAGDGSRWMLSARMSWPLFDGHAREADEDRARAVLRQAEANRRLTALQIVLEVEEALIELERAAERIEASRKSVTSADARLRSARAKYAAGRGILLEVTDARASFTAASADLVRARFDRQVALVVLQRATGTLPVPTVPGPEGAEGD